MPINDLMQIMGHIIAPHRDAWGTCSKRWLYFLDVHGMTVDGSGVIDGQGEAWWGNVSNTHLLNILLEI